MKYHTLTDKTEDGIRQKIDDYLRKFPVAGYGTTISPYYFNPHGELWTANVTRRENCD